MIRSLLAFIHKKLHSLLHPRVWLGNTQSDRTVHPPLFSLEVFQGSVGNLRGCGAVEFYRVEQVFLIFTLPSMIRLREQNIRNTSQHNPKYYLSNSGKTWLQYWHQAPARIAGIHSNLDFLPWNAELCLSALIWQHWRIFLSPLTQVTPSQHWLVFMEGGGPGPSWSPGSTGSRLAGTGYLVRSEGCARAGREGLPVVEPAESNI